MNSNFGKKSLLFLPLLLILCFFYLPLFNIVSKGLNRDFFYEIFSSFYYRKIISFTIFQAFLSSFLSILIAIPGSYLVTRYNFVGKKLFLSLASLPFVLPSILTVLGFVLLFGNSGIINSTLQTIFGLEKPPLRILYTLKAVLLAHIFYNFPLAIRIISSRWKKIPHELTEASNSLGAGKFKTFRKVTLPFLTPSIITSFTLIFLYCFMSFGIILVLGGGPSLSTIEVEVYRFARISLNMPKATSLSIIESFITILVLSIYLKSEKNSASFISGHCLEKQLSNKSRIFFTLYLIPLFIILIAPLVTIIVSSFLKKTGYTNGQQLSLHWYKSIFLGVTNSFKLTSLNAIKNSLILAFSSVILTVPFALLVTFNLNLKIKFRSLYTLIFFLPMGISSIIIGLSYLTLDVPRSYILIILAHTIIALPLGIRSINNIYKTISYSLIESSMSLGYNRFKTFLYIELPLLKSGITTAAIFSFALSIGEMNASIMLAPSGFVTIPLAIYQLIGSYNFYGACALGSILLFLCLFSFIFIDRFENSKTSV